MPRHLAQQKESPAPALVGSFEALGQLVRQQRLALRMRIDDAAGLCGVSANVMSRLENGKDTIGVDRLLLVLDGLGLSLAIGPKPAMVDRLREART